MKKLIGISFKWAGLYSKLHLICFPILPSAQVSLYFQVFLSGLIVYLIAYFYDALVYTILN